MKHTIICMACLAATILTGCASRKVEVTAYATLNKATEEIQVKMEENGYTLYDRSKSEDGERKQDTYSFKNPEGDSFEYSVAYDLRDYDDIYYVKDVKLNGCKVSNGADYTKFCGLNAPVQQIEKLPEDTTVKEFSAGKLIFNLVGLPLIILGGLYTVLIIAAAAAS